MSIFTDHPRLRWAAPAAAVAVTAAATLAVSLSGNASADASLGPRTAAQLLVDVQQARLAGLSGTVVQTSNLGLPDIAIPGAGGKSSSELSSTVTGSHTWRVWYAGPDKARLALAGAMGESDIVRNGKDVWLWSSQTKSATHYSVPADKTGSNPMPTPTDLPKTPQEAATRALEALDPTTVVSSPGTTTVAGRAAYELVLTPRQAGSLVKSVRIAVDGEQRVPLRVQVFSTRVSDPAFEVGFTSVDFSVPEARQFAFDPPPGTKVTEGKNPTAEHPAASGAATAADTAKPRIVGTGWSTVVVATMPTPSTDQSNASGSDQLAQFQGLLSSLPKVSGAWGSGRLLNGTLFSVLLTDDGKVVAGAVEPQSLYAALGSK